MNAMDRTAADHGDDSSAVRLSAEAGNPSATVGPAPPLRPAVRRADFLARIDQCVRYLAAHLSAPLPAAPHDATGIEAAELASAELWYWLHARPAVLDDGTPITFALFDTALQRVGERLPRRGLPGQENVLRAAWLLAEATHAPTRAPIAGLMPAAALP